MTAPPSPDTPAPDASDGTTYDVAATSVARGGFWNFGGQLAGVGAGLIATPFTIRLLGPVRYGIVALIQSVLTWLTLADAGMAQASTRFGGERVAKGDGDGEAEMVWTAAVITICSTALVASAAALAAPLIVRHVMGVHGSLSGPTVTCLRLLAGASIAGVAAGTLNTPLITRFRWRSFTIVTAGAGVLQVVALPLALDLLGGGLVTAGAVYLATASLSALGTLWFSVRLQPRMRRPRASLTSTRKLLRYGGGLTIAGFAGIPLGTAERLLLGHYKAAAAVAYYAVAARLAGMVSAIPNAVSQPLFPTLVTLEASDRPESARALYGQALQGMFLLLTPLALILAFVAHPFLTLWAGRIYGVHSTDPFYVLLGGVWFNSLTFLPITSLMVIDRTKLIAWLYVLEVGPYIVAAAVLTATMGVMGAAIVAATRSAVDAVLLFMASRRTGSFPVSPLPRRPVHALTVCVALAAALVGLSAVTASLPVRTGYGIALLALYWLLTLRIVLTARERAGLLAVASRLGPLGRLTSGRQRSGDAPNSG